MDTNFLMASVFWGAIGSGYFVYGKKQRSIVPTVGGIVMIVMAYFVSSALMMSLLSIVLIVGIHYLLRQGY